ncbi:S9 family peptidase [Flavobacterium agrisoli]|uniref:S9 family peptidase n=1 Tax=Flavobacterium agrisoli TaxID=2793066 RepID=A0A934UIN6_9FLAO|nr:prolyl oligopeptidase family serine peptidase [Flavobacterium agrisoli]MBK0368628.1 S9 family peptidase [Flavobacterium agrisoli]
MKQHIQLVYRFFAVLILGLVACPASGQDLIQRQLTKDDYNLWCRLETDKISENGRWISYALRYESRLDTLFVKSTYTSAKYEIAGALNGQFASEDIFACLDQKENLHLVNLISGNSILIKRVKKFDFSGDGRFLISLESNDDSSMNLTIRKKNGKLVQRIENVTQYAINNSGNALLYSTAQSGSQNAGLVNLKQKISIRDVIQNIHSDIKSLTLSEDGSTAAFYTQDSLSTHLYYYQLPSGSVSVLKDLPADSFDNKIITIDSSVPLKISDDNRSVFFAYKNSVHTIMQNPVVELWKNDDKYLYPNTVLAQSYNKPFLAVWYPKIKLAHPLSSEKYSWAALTGNQNYAMVADVLQYEPQYDLFAPMDYYLVNISTNEKDLIVSNQSGHIRYMQFSPNGSYICYYKNDSWHLYDINKKKSSNLTLNSSYSSEDLEDPLNRKKVSFEFYAWSSDGRSILFYDKYDIWQFFINGNPPIRLTNGKEKRIRFRFASLQKERKRSNYSSVKSLDININAKKIVEVFDTMNGASGYSVLDHEKGLQPLIFADARISNIRKAAKRDIYCFESENFDKSPTLVLKYEKESKLKTIAQTNPQQKSFYWGHSEMIHYKDYQNNTSSGALFYPAGYNPKKKYPMVVYIYEKLSHKVHHYITPSSRSTNGFNIAHLTSNGYFVLMPDIYYERGNTGISTTQCVESAVKEVIEKGLVDSFRVGIMGHSFGGYEVDFIITNSTMFAAAVSGAGVSDNIRGYLTVNSEFNNAEIWRFENQQYRMKGSFYEDKESYLRNSPVFNANKVNTPILIWTGKNDNNVKPEQSTAFFLALRRLNKKSVMLQYPNEGHTLLSKNPQEDLNNKIMEWFDYYLKDEYPKEWITSTDEKKSNLNP